MGLEIAVLRKKCLICRVRRSQRYCLRTGKDICWSCCNNNRIDRKCPKECSYIIREADSRSAESLSAKCDSYNELINLLALSIDFWTELPEKQLDNEIPSELATTAEGKKRLAAYIDSIYVRTGHCACPYTVLHPKTINYLRKKLHLPPKNIPYSHYEDTGDQYLDFIVQQEWEKTIDLMFNNSRYENHLYRDNYLKRRANNKLLKRTTSYRIILSVIAENKNEAMVYYEVNGKYDLTINLLREGNEWKVNLLILGNPQLYYGIPEIENQIIALLTQNMLDEAEKKLKSFSEILIDSPQIHYLYGLFFSMKEDYSEAKEMFLTCTEVAPEIFDYKYNFAFTTQISGDPNSAKQIYDELLEEKPDDLKTLNNIAVIELNKGNIKKAKQIWKQCLNIDDSFTPAKNNLTRIDELTNPKSSK